MFSWELWDFDVVARPLVENLAVKSFFFKDKGKYAKAFVREKVFFTYLLVKTRSYPELKPLD